MKHRIFLLYLFFTICYSFSYSQEQTVKIKVESIRSVNGQLILALFKTNDQFEEEEPFKSIILDKNYIKNGVLSVNVDLPVGKYGISLLDDENKNKLMDYSFFGIPEEGFGFSNFEHTGFLKPDLKVFTISIQSNKEQSISFKVRYM